MNKNKIVWVMGQSAAGKDTFIQYAVNKPDSELIQKLGYSNYKIIPISDNYGRKEISFNYHDRIKIMDIVLDFLKKETNAAIFIKWQFVDNDEHADVIRKLKDATPDIPNEMIMLSVDSDVLYARLPNKWWWNESTSSTQEQEQMNDVVKILRYNIMRWQCLGLKFTAEIDATDGYKIIENSELKYERNISHER